MSRLKRFAPWISLLLMTVCLAVVWRELRHIHFDEVQHEIRRLPTWRLLAAAGLVAANYLVLIGYDWLAVKAVGRRLAWWRVALASFAGFATSYNVNALLGGTAIRYRFYSQWGFTTVEMLRMLMMLSVTFWIGVLALSGIVFVIQPIEIPEKLHLPFRSLQPLGILLTTLTVTYVVTVAVRKQPIRFRSTEFPLPTLGQTLLQLLVAGLDLSIAAGSLFILIGPDLQLTYLQFLAVYLLAIVLVTFSSVPGGIGLFELVVISFSGSEPTPALLAALVIFRILYYLGPLVIAIAWVAGYELLASRGRTAEKAEGDRAGQAVWLHAKRWWTAIAPAMMAVAAFSAGTILLISGATPGEKSRMLWLEKLIPLSLLEASHFMGSIVGVGLLLLARGLQRRIDTAYWLTLTLLGFGSLFSLLKGWDYEEATYVAVLMLILIPCRRAFYRRGALLTQPLSPSWLMSMFLVVIVSTWLALFVNKHVEYRDELWWEFTLHGDAPRSLRAVVGTGVLLLILSVMRLFSFSAPKPQRPSAQDTADAAVLADADPRTACQLVALGDKQLLFDASRESVIMYGCCGRSWIAMGDPIGNRKHWPELVWRFRELADSFGGRPVFYQVGTEALTVYLDQGLTLLKLGEEAIVPLASFGIEGGHRKGLRQTVNRMEKEGASFTVLEHNDFTPALPRLREISDHWLAEKKSREKGFSLGFFSEEYLKRYRTAIVRHQSRIVAFANIWEAADKSELSIDLMRYVNEAPAGVMEYLLIELMRWGREQKFDHFNLGMAPLSGIDANRLAPLWNRTMNMVFHHGDRFYSFEGLRQYKDKFRPEWRPKYLAAPGGIGLPRILADVTVLISRGH